LPAAAARFCCFFVAMPLLASTDRNGIDVTPRERVPVRASVAS
jgi:hypothetical protein